MIASSTLFSFSLIFFLLFLGSTSGSAPDLIKQTCKSISRSDPINIKYHFCIFSLQAAPASSCANLTRLGQISINLVKNNATDTKCLIRRLLDDRRVHNRTKVGLRDCYDLYSDSVLTVREAAKDYRAKRFADANVKVSSIMDSSGSCDQGFREIGADNPLRTRNNDAFQLSAIALSFINLFHHPRSTTTSLKDLGGSAMI